MNGWIVAFLVLTGVFILEVLVIASLLAIRRGREVADD